jgi:hypothetical protein
MRFSSVLATELGFLAVIIALFLFNALHYWPQAIDDAFIAFRFAENLADGRGLRFNADGPLVEGFTSPAWVVLSAFAITAGEDPLVVAKVAGLVSGVLLILLSWHFPRNLRRRVDGWNLLPPLLIATNAHVAFWAMQGMEPLLQCAALLAAMHATLHYLRHGDHPLLAGALVVFAVFVRIDSLLLLLPLGIFFLVQLLLHAPRLKTLLPDIPPTPSIGMLLPWAGGVLACLALLQFIRLATFRDWLPNTYYAKVALPPWNGERANAYLVEFFFNQGGWGPPNAINGLAWLILWLATLILLAFVPARRSLPGHLLLLSTLATSTWYAWHVGGDWMPGFRFLLPVVVFIAVATPFAIDAWNRLAGSLPRVRHFGLAVFLLAAAGTLTEQLRTETAYVFGRDPIWVERTQRWLSVAAVRERLSRGFEPALLDTTAALALETQPGTTIFMSDIGLPLWSSPYLRVIDADGLVDRRIADAPRFREPPTRAEILRELLADVGNRPLTRRDRRDLRQQAERLYREEVTDRNARLVMERLRPEYILVFEVHPGTDTSQPGHRYPEIIEHATRLPEFQNYTLARSWPKAEGNVWNHLYRRSDVEAELTAEERAQRLNTLRIRNPHIRIFALLQAASQLADE